MSDEVPTGEWNSRAAAAQAAVLNRFVWRMPGLAWARSTWPALPAATRRAEHRAGWHYWWSAHLVDAAIDAVRHRPRPSSRSRSPSPLRRDDARAFARGIRLRNGGTFSRPFWDDLAWLGLAFQRGGALLGRQRTVTRISARLEAAIDPATGAIPWRVGSTLFNAPANGPAAILLARTGRHRAASALADWMHEHLADPATGLIRDGLIIDGARIEAVATLYTYCQGVVLGAYLAVPSARSLARAADLIAALERWTAVDGGVLPGSGGGDGGLFAGITCRYLAAAARQLDAMADADADAAAAGRMRGAAASARSLVLRNADAVWHGRATLDALPVFATDWRRAADPSPGMPERDLSVQLGAWLALEAAVEVSAAHPPDPTAPPTAPGATAPPKFGPVTS